MKHPNDVILMKALKKGHKDAYSQAYRKYHHQLLQFARKYVKSNKLAEDAVQDIFIKLWEARERLKEQKSLKGFLYVTLKNHVLNMIRDAHQEIYEAYEPQASLADGRNEIEEGLIYREYQEVAKEAIAQLSAKRRHVFEMKRNTDLSNEQIANKLGVSVSTVKSQYYRGSQLIKSHLKKHINSFENKEL
jgi:RNA polymerase sigma-70 factor (ECF subfamily)